MSNCTLFDPTEAVVGESVVVIKKLLQMQVNVQQVEELYIWCAKILKRLYQSHCVTKLYSKIDSNANIAASVM